MIPGTGALASCIIVCSIMKKGLKKLKIFMCTSLFLDMLWHLSVLASKILRPNQNSHVSWKFNICLVHLRTTYNSSYATHVQSQLMPLNKLPIQGSHPTVAGKQLSNTITCHITWHILKFLGTMWHMLVSPTFLGTLWHSLTHTTTP